MIRLAEIQELPQCDTGAPMPFVLSNDYTVKIIYYIIRDWSDENAFGKDEIAVITFDRFKQLKFGSPNDEAIHGHPFSKYGLSAHSFYEVENSPWIEELRIMNSVHHRHSDNMFEGLKHFIATFHDNTFEIIHRGFSFEIFNDKTYKEIVVKSTQDLF